MQDKPVALVSGANKGIGRQIAKDLATHRFTMLVGSGNLEHVETAAKGVGADARTPSSSASRLGFTSTSRRGVSYERSREVRSRRLYRRAA
jgi:NAD(P)-dependent dehydrogenase (short-subunit alcohol dehydrogenase family)